MQLIPSLVLQHLADPAKFENLFIQYIKDAGLTITNSKTIAGVAYFHKKVFPTGATSMKFFSGTFDPLATNLPGNSFIRPESEHFLIWALRVETNVTAIGGIYDPGVVSSAFLYNTIATVTTNSEVKQKKYPLSEALSALTVREDGLIPFSEPIFWAGQQEFEIEVANGDGTVAPALQFMKLTLIGIALI